MADAHQKQANRRSRRGAFARVGLVVAMAVAAVAASGSSVAAQGPSHLDPEQFGISTFTTASSDMQAGSHPDVNTTFEFAHELRPNVIPILPPEPWTFGRVERMEFDLPAGLVGDPTAIPTCPVDQFLSEVECPAAAQVGITDILASGFFGQKFVNSPVVNLEPGADQPALFGVKPVPSLHALIEVRVNPDGTLTAVVDNVTLGHPLVFSDLTMWGVPADPSYDKVRGLCGKVDADGNGDPTDDDECPANAPRVPFMTGATECETIPTTRMSAWSYEDKAATAVHSLDTAPFGCDIVPFEPTMTAAPTNRAAAAPTGLEVDIKVPQNDLPDGRASAHVRDVEVVLPEGMKVSPSAANGLAACSPAEFGYRQDSAVTCPDASKIGTVRVDTPLLEEPMTGVVYLPKQNDNPFNSLLGLYIELEGAGQTIKLAGRVDPDPVTGQLRTTFVDSPQLPFERLRLSLKTGPRAPLTNPQTCGTYHTETSFKAWTGKVVSASTPMKIDQSCQPVGFSPSFEAGSTNPVAGSMSDFTLTFGRSDHDQELRDVAVDMPEGLLAKIASVERCPDAAANAGTCGEGARIGSVTTAAGPGSSPFSLPGRAYLTDGYKGGQFGMSIVVPAVAGPFDLGLVVVRAAIHVDRTDASVRVVSDSIPRILQGIPTQVQSVNVTIDRPDFMVNPTGCNVRRVSARIVSGAGTTADVGSRFQVGECGALRFKPRLKVSLTGRKETRTGRHPGIRAQVDQTGIGESAIDKAAVTLPRSLALDPDNAQALCEFVDGTKPDLENHCPKGSIVGRARARTPLLGKDLVGDVYFVKDVRRDSRTGNQIRTLPMIVVALRGEIAVNLIGKSSTTRNGRLVNTFAEVPDAPITRFNLNIKGGKSGIVAVTRTRRARINLCTRPKSHVAEAEIEGQSGKRRDFDLRVKTPCAKRAAKKVKVKG